MSPPTSEQKKTSKKAADMKPTPLQLMESYPEVAAAAQRMCNEVHRQLEVITISEGYVLGFPVQSRVKNYESTLSKLEDEKIKISSLYDMQDISGIRITLLFDRDIQPIIKKIGEIVDVIKTYNTTERLKDDQFGYSSFHLIIKLKDEWLKMPSCIGLNNSIMEIQVRTLAQHTWAAASHALQYKREDSTPKPLRRSINRIAALLELIDIELERLLKEQQEYKNDLDISHNQELNIDILEALLDDIYPSDNKKSPEPYESLLNELNLLEITTINQLKAILLGNLEDTKELDREKLDYHVKRIEEGTIKLSTKNQKIMQERMSKGVYMAHVGLARTSLKIKFGEDVILKIQKSLTNGATE